MVDGPQRAGKILGKAADISALAEPVEFSPVSTHADEVSARSVPAGRALDFDAGARACEEALGYRLSAEYIGGTCRVSPRKPAAHWRTDASSSAGTGAVSTVSPSRSPVAVLRPRAMRNR